MATGARPIGEGAFNNRTEALSTTTGSPSPTEKRAALEEVLQSSVFRRADQLRKFLGFICEMEISGRADELCEYLIGVEALGRPSDYSPAEDAAVRRRAADLREKLHETYADELAGSKLCIDLPKGAYVPRFVRPQPITLQVARTGTFPLPAPRPTAPVRYAGFTFAFALGIVITLLVLADVPSIRQFLLAKSSAAAQPRPGVIYEAESSHNTLAGAVRAKACSTCSGGQKVGFIGNGAANYVAIDEPNVALSGPYQMEVDYLLNGSRSFFISVNDGPGVELPLTGRSWLAPASATIPVTLKAGPNRIVFYNEKDFAPDLDRIVLR